MPDRNTEDELRDDELPDEADVEDADATVACHACGAAVYHDSERCPVCGEWLDESAMTAIGRGRRWWWLALAAAGIGAVVIAMLFG